MLMPSRFRLSLLPAAIALLTSLCIGCSQEDSTGYSQYRADPDRASKGTPQESGPGKREQTAAGTPSAVKSDPDAAQYEAALPAGVGLLSLTYRQFADERKQDAASVAAIGSAGVSLTSDAESAGTSEVAAANTGNGEQKPGAVKPLAKPRKIKLLVKDKSFQTVGPQGAIRVSYDDISLLKVLNMDPVPTDALNYLPKWMKELDGKRIRIRGFMSPAFKQQGITSFLMGRDNKACCFPGTAKVYDLFPVKLRDGVTTHFIDNRPFDVVGVFHIKPWVEDGEWYQIYQITDAVIIQ